MFAVTVTFVITLEKLDEFIPIMIRQAHNSLPLEQGDLLFSVCQEQENPERVFLYEICSDRDTSEAHLETEHFFDFEKTVSPWTVPKVTDRW